jgi:penicillin-binding protein
MSSNSGTNNSRWVAYLVNAIYQSNPAIIGVEDKFDRDTGVTKSKVNKFTGELPGKVTLPGGKTQDTPGDTTTSLWSNGKGAPASTYEFGIGGTSENYKKAWEDPNFKGTDPNAIDVQ